ncbi:protein of unknown function [Legionella fallonii LLAP-10]|uniref:Uncharacterized protein n=1 Tax=Legionella fallonii LLAP-10 TaxID=1212491 RepID=A0A098G2J1_9GAMM|nr:protein of unknown function [Legionella fallonii LLAP-10]
MAHHNTKINRSLTWLCLLEISQVSQFEPDLKFENLGGRSLFVSNYSEKAHLSTEIVNDRIKDQGHTMLTNPVKVRFKCNEWHLWNAKPNNKLNCSGLPGGILIGQ